MSGSKITLAGIKLRADRPTNIAFADIAGWVIWQYPRREKKGYRGAVRPPVEGEYWRPAIVQPGKAKVRIYGHIDTRYKSPEDAAAFFNEAEQG